MSIETVSPQACVGAVVIRDDALLVIRRGRGPSVGQWSIPGGRVQLGEALVEAVVRELAEETGLEGICGEFIGWAEVIGEDGHFVILDFYCTLLGDQKATAADDAVEVAWVPLNDVAELHLVDGLAEFLHHHDIIRTIV